MFEVMFHLTFEATGYLTHKLFKMFGPLAFEDQAGKQEEERETECLLCADRFNLKFGLHIFLSHLFEVHSFVIEDVQNIDNLPR